VDTVTRYTRSTVWVEAQGSKTGEAQALSQAAASSRAAPLAIKYERVCGSH